MDGVGEPEDSRTQSPHCIDGTAQHYASVSFMSLNDMGSSMGARTRFTSFTDVSQSPRRYSFRFAEQMKNLGRKRKDLPKLVQPVSSKI